MSAAVYQSGGTATLSGKATVGYNGTALSFYDISGGMLNANGGLLVGGNLGNGNGQGNGLVDIAGSGVVNITGGAGLQIGQDTTLATSGLLSLSGSGTLSVTGNVSLGSGGGIAAFSRSGGSMTVTGGLIVGGNATLLLDASTANVATSFGGALSRVSPGTLVVIPNTGNLGTTEAVSFGTAPTRVNGIIGPWAVQQTSGTVTSGDYLTASGHNLATFSGYNSGFSGAGANSLVNVSSPSSTTGTTIYAMKVSDTATISSGTLTLSSGGMILNGGMVTGGTLAFSNSSTSLIYAGSSNPGTIASTIQGSLGLVKFGPGSLVLSGSNGQTLSGPIVVSSGTLNVQNSGALGAGGAGSPVTVAAGAALELQNNVALGNVPITLNGMGPSGGGALSNVQDNNSLAGTITLGSNSQINTTAGTLTLSGLIQGSYDLTTSGAGTLVLAGTSTLFGAVNITNGTVMAENSAALGPAGGIGTTVQSGATLGVQGGISLPAAVVLNGFGTGSGAALESFQGQNSLTGPVTLATDSQINVDAGMLTISGNISGASALSTGGTGTLVLSGTGNSFTGGLTVLSGTLSVPGVNNAGSPGPLGAGTTPVVLGSDSTAATLLYTGSGTSSNQAFTLAAGGGVVSVNSSLGLSGTIDGSGSLTKVGSGTLTLSGSNLYTGATTVASGTLAVSSTGSINSTSAIVVNQGALLQVTAGSTGQLPDSASITLNGGNLSYIGNGSTNPGELAGPLVLNPGQSNVAVSNTGSGTAYLCFASGPVSHTIGATVNFSPGSNSSIQFQAIAPLSNGIIGGYAFYNNGDFATWALAGSNNTPTIEQYTGYTLGNLASVGTSGSLNVSPTGSQGSLTQSTTINSLRLTNGVGVTITGSNVLALNSGGLIANTTGSISGGTLSAPNGELIVNTLQHLTISSAISASTALVKTGSDTLTLTSTTPVTGDTYLNQGILEYAPAGSVSYGGVISGAGNLLKSGTGSLTLTGTSTYYGGTSVTGGVFSVNGLLGAGTTVSVQGGGALAGSGTIAGNVVVSGGAIALGPSGSILGTVTANGSLTVGQSGVGDYLNTIGGLNIAGTGTLAASSTAATISGSLTYASSSNSTYSGVISGSGQTVTLGPSAAGTLTLSGSNLYTGGTFVQGGTLKTANPGALGTGGLTLSSGGTLDLDGLANLTVPSLSGAGGTILTSTGSSTLTVNTATGVSTNYSGTIANGTNGTGTLAFAKSGNGTLRLSGTGSYTGGTTVSGGVLIIDSSEAIPSGSTVAVSAGAMLILGDPSLPGYPMATGNTGSGAGVLQSDSSTSAVNSASGVSTDYGGSITGNVGLVKSGSGTLTLSGSNSYTGGTTINDGTLVLTNTAAIPDGSTVWMSTTGSGMLILGDPNLSDGLGLATGDVDSGAGIFQPTASPAVKATPEPGTLTLLLAGLVGLGVTTLRRRMKG
jgi:autotransporter-associated beta strand protein